MNEIPYSHGLMNRVKVLSGAILDSRRDGVQVHASHFSSLPGGVRCRPDLPSGTTSAHRFACAPVTKKLCQGPLSPLPLEYVWRRPGP